LFTLRLVLKGLTLTTTNTKIQIMKPYHKEMEIIEYDGIELQICSVSLVTQHVNMGEDEVLYKCMDRHGNLKEVLDWELLKYRMEAAKCSA